MRNCYSFPARNIPVVYVSSFVKEITIMDARALCRQTFPRLRNCTRKLFGPKSIYGVLDIVVIREPSQLLLWHVRHILPYIEQLPR